MTAPDAPPPNDALVDHRSRAETQRARLQGLERAALYVSFGRLLAFLGVVILGVGAYAERSAELGWATAAVSLAFGALVFHHARLHQRLRDAEVREKIHRRHLLRIEGGWLELPFADPSALVHEHPYARDIDLVGEGSLLQRIDVSHTERGVRTLTRWLSAPADARTIARRGEAVRELSARVDLREDLEAEAEIASGEAKLDAGPFLAFVRHDPAFDRRLAPLIYLLPPLTLGLFVASSLGALPSAAFGFVFLAQAALALIGSARASEALGLVSARRGYVEAFRRLLVTVEEADVDSSLLREIRGRVEVSGVPPSRFMARLDRWAGLAELRTQFPVHFFVNIALLWDLHVLYHLERWTAEVGRELEDVFEALADLEALASLATLVV